jgi:hypothetical protein
VKTGGGNRSGGVGADRLAHRPTPTRRIMRIIGRAPARRCSGGSPDIFFSLEFFRVLPLMRQGVALAHVREDGGFIFF